jgi:DNA-binding transcriptional MerR regulator
MTKETQRARYGIRELVQASGVPRRTVRYYVQIGLLAPPAGAGRGHYYLPAHLERLVRIRDLRQQGRSLDEIRALLDRGDAGTAPLDLPPLELTTRIRLSPGVEVVVSHGAEPPTRSQLRALARAAARILRNE